MRILLDENLPKRLKQDLAGFEVFTVRDKGWQGKSNGELMNLILENQFDVLMTFDKNLEHQQNFLKFPVTVFLLNAQDNTYLTLKHLVPQIKSRLVEPLEVGVNEITR